jgi:putative hydrolase of HD superfamily
MLETALLDALALKDVDRAGWRRVGHPHPESVAAHSWGVALLVLTLCPPDLDRGRALAIAILHDLAEARVGDLTPHNGVARDEKRRREEEAMRAMLAPLSNADELFALWLEYEDGSTAEGRFVKACDKLDMGLQAHRYAATGLETSEHLEAARAALTRELAALLAR